MARRVLFQNRARNSHLARIRQPIARGEDRVMSVRWYAERHDTTDVVNKRNTSRLARPPHSGWSLKEGYKKLSTVHRQPDSSAWALSIKSRGWAYGPGSLKHGKLPGSLSRYKKGYHSIPEK